MLKLVRAGRDAGKLCDPAGTRNCRKAKARCTGRRRRATAAACLRGIAGILIPYMPRSGNRTFNADLALGGQSRRQQADQRVHTHAPALTESPSTPGIIDQLRSSRTTGSPLIARPQRWPIYMLPVHSAAGSQNQANSIGISLGARICWVWAISASAAASPKTAGKLLSL